MKIGTRGLCCLPDATVKSDFQFDSVKSRFWTDYVCCPILCVYHVIVCDRWSWCLWYYKCGSSYMYLLWFDLRKLCMCAYFPNTIEPCRKSIRDGKLIRAFENWLSCLITLYTQRGFAWYDIFLYMVVQ